MNAVVFVHPTVTQSTWRIRNLEIKTGRKAVAVSAKKVVLLPPPTLITSRKKKQPENDWFTNGPNNAA